MSRDEIIEKLRKLMVLAERGEGGEAVNARAMLDIMMQKHDLTEADLNDSAPRSLVYTIDNEDERLLLLVILTNVLKVDQNDAISVVAGNTKTSTIIRLSTEQHALAASLYEHHRAGLAQSKFNAETEHKRQLDRINLQIAVRKKETSKLEQARKEERSDYKGIKYGMLNAYTIKNGLQNYLNVKKASPEYACKVRGASQYAKKVGNPNSLPPQSIGDGRYINQGDPTQGTLNL